MHYFITNVSFNLLVKEFLTSMNVWQSFRQKGWMCHMPHSPQDVCPQRCRTHKVSKITCVLWTEAVANCCYINRQINETLFIINKYHTFVNQFWLNDWQTDAISNWLTADDHVRYITATSLSLLQELCTINIGTFLYGRCERRFVTDLTNKYFTRQIFLKFFEWLSLTRQFASISSGARSFFEQIFHTVV